MRRLSSLLFLPVTVVASTTTSATSNANNDNSSSNNNNNNHLETCRLYLAPSSKSSSEEFKWGMYTAETIPANEQIGFENLAIAIHHLKAHNKAALERADSEYWQSLVTLLSNFLWTPEIAGAADEVSVVDPAQPANLAVFGPGFLAAFDSTRSNADWDISAAYHRATHVEKEIVLAHPNRGANTPLNKVTLRATQEIPAGSEIIVHFDDHSSEDEGSKDENSISNDDYRKIDETILQMLTFFEKHASLDDKAKELIYKFLVHDFMEAAVGPIKARKVAELLPSSPLELPNVPLAGGILKYANNISNIQKQRVEWMRKSGYCIDYVKPGVSTIPHAGLGAFATRSLPKDSVIVPVPLLHIPDQDALNMYELIKKKGALMPKGDKAQDRQLALNYCLGHADSTMVFLPTSSVVYMNHNGKEPNARLRWASNMQTGHSNADWIEVGPTTMVDYDQYHMIGLLMEVVALRDIKEGEEIFLDYGREWEAAWNAHQIAWGDAEEEMWPWRAADMNAYYQTRFFPTEQEVEDDPESHAPPPHVTLKAFIMVDSGAGEGTEESPYTYVEPKYRTQLTASMLYEAYITKRYDLAAENKQPFDGANMALPYLYTVRVVPHEDSEILEQNEDEDELYITNVPHSALIFVDHPETGDQFTTQPFRHWIGIPDDVFPQGSWRNKK